MAQKPPPLTDDDVHLFRDAVAGARPMPQDKIPPARIRSKQKSSAPLASVPDESHLFWFSDAFEGYQAQGSTISYAQPGEDPHLPRRLKRGEFTPAVLLDLHGLSQQDAKIELAGMLHYCQQNHHNCACVVHGKGSGILAKRVPNWLIQHPNVRAFHTAPTHWGRDGALLLLLKTPD